MSAAMAVTCQLAPHSSLMRTFIRWSELQVLTLSDWFFTLPFSISSNDLRMSKRINGFDRGATWRTSGRSVVQLSLFSFRSEQLPVLHPGGATFNETML